MVALGAVAAAAPAPAIVSTGRLVLDGGPFREQPLTVTAVTGDWYATSDDGHVSLTIKGTAGTQQVSLDLQWDGAARQHVIDAQSNSDMGGRHVSFFLRFGPSAGQPALARPARGDAITIGVDKADDHDLQATITGTTTSDTKVDGAAPSIRLSGSLNLHRASVTRLRSGEYGPCDPTIYDKMVGAEWRSPSACEVRFDADLRAAFQKAFDPAINALAGEHWVVARAAKADPIDSIARHTENQPYRMDFTRNGAFSLQLRQDPNGDVIRAYQQRQQDVMARMEKGSSPALTNELLALMNEQHAHTFIAIGVSANLPAGESFVNFTGAVEPLSVPGSVYAVWAPAIQASTGGGAGNARGGARILFGRFGAAMVKKQSDGASQVHAASQFAAGAPPLSIQTMSIRIDAARPLVDRVLRLVQFDALRALVQ
jgi:hypothetical protein